ISPTTVKLIVTLNHRPANEQGRDNRRRGRQDPDNMMNLSSANEFLELADKEQLKQANERLEKILSNLGVTTEVIQNMEAKYGKNVNGVADIVKKIIELEDKKYLPEEAAHIIISMLS